MSAPEQVPVTAQELFDDLVIAQERLRVAERKAEHFWYALEHAVDVLRSVGYDSAADEVLDMIRG